MFFFSFRDFFSGSGFAAVGRGRVLKHWQKELARAVKAARAYQGAAQKHAPAFLSDDPYAHNNSGRYARNLGGCAGNLLGAGAWKYFLEMSSLSKISK